MSLAEIEFELSAHQYELMGYPGLQQGESLSVAAWMPACYCLTLPLTVGSPFNKSRWPPSLA